jgi:regulator of cell morphogenesis and NO signaling
MTLSELAIHIPISIELFEKYGFNYYENGKQTFKKACEEKGLVFTEIDAELNQLQLSLKTKTMLTLDDMSIDRLIDFINGQHHSNEEEVLNLMATSIKKTISDPSLEESLAFKLKTIDVKFSEFKETLMRHCEKEDKVLFPYMRKLYESRRDKALSNINFQKTFGKNPIQLLENEHSHSCSILSEIKYITQNFSASASAPEAYRLLMKNLKEFETDFHVHLHIENNILFPKVIALMDQLNINDKSA